MGRSHCVSLRRRHDIPIRRREDVPLRRCWVFHLKRTCDVATTSRCQVGEFVSMSEEKLITLHDVENKQLKEENEQLKKENEQLKKKK